LKQEIENKKKNKTIKKRIRVEKMSKKIILLIIILVLVGIAAGYVIYQNEQPASTNIMKGNHTILLLTADPSEKRPGIGAVDMAFAIGVSNGSVTNLTPIYPGEMRSATATEPPEAGTGKMLLHDSLWYADTAADVKNSQEIVETNTGIKTDAVVIVTPEAVDAILNSIGPIDVPGYTNGTNASINYIRNMTEEKGSTLSRGQASELLMKPVLSAMKDPSKSPALFQAALQQYLKGNIVVIPSDLMTQFAIAKGLKLI
jgi:anionic cell wall polymer biosynthesis LytR-Cps2A-Psr (LCP) family protein